MTSAHATSRSLLTTAALVVAALASGGLPQAVDLTAGASAAAKTSPNGATPAQAADANPAARGHSIRTRSRRAYKQARPTIPARGWTAQPSLEAATLAGINATRKKHGLRPLRVSTILKRPARSHARFLAVKRKGVLQHEDARGRPFYYRLVKAGWRKNARMSENLASINACRAKDPRIMLRRWMASPSHRANILDPKITHVGVGVMSSAQCLSTVYATDFGN